MQTTQQPQQIQNGGLISAPNEQYARTYPVAPGNSVAFKDEFKPCVYIKTANLNPMVEPDFKVYVEAQNGSNPGRDSQTDNSPQYVMKGEFDDLKATVDTLRKSISLFSDKETIENAE
jgi:hypothetical protein